MIEDIVEIEQLLSRYCHAVDRGTVSDIMDVFHRDAVLLPRYQSEESFKGKEAVRGWYESYDKTARDRTRSLRHTISTPLIQVDGNSATSVCYLDADGIDSDSGRAFQVLGRYEDKLIKEEGRWWIAERAIIVEGNYALGEAREIP
ncbi:MAG: nuclear transport factor 2 family protein [Myxococcota bacterium]